MNDTIWADGVWAAGVWAEGVWAERGIASVFEAAVRAHRRRRVNTS